MSTHQYKIICIFFTFIYWIIDSSIHKVLYGEENFEFIPRDFNELWMRCIIVFLIIFLGSYADYSTQKRLKLEEEKERIFFETVKVTKIIMEQFIIKMFSFKFELIKNSDMNSSKLDEYNQLISETKEQIKKLESISKVTKENIRDGFLPRK